MVRPESNFTVVKRVIRAVPLARWKAKKEGIDLSLIKGSGPDGLILLRDIEKFKKPEEAPRIPASGKKIWASSLARKLAEREGISLEKIQGTGTHGRIMMADVLRSLKKRASANEGKDLFGKTFPMTQMRKVIAKRMSQSAFTAPHIYFFTDIEMDGLNRLRDQVLSDFERGVGVRISLNDFFIKAVALTIGEFPILNSQLRGEEIYIMPEINIGLAVALEEGLIVPAIPQADRLSLGEIAKIRTDLVERSRSGRLRLEEIERGTFTISSLAQFDISFFTAILNPPQSGILSIGKTMEQLTLKEGKIVANQIARFGLSVDHRIIDGATAAAFLQSLKRRLEEPESLQKIQ